MQHIETVTVGSGGASSIVFASIPQTFTDLLVKLSVRSSVAGVNDVLRFGLNGVTTDITSRYLAGNSSITFSFADARFVSEISGNGATASTFGSVDFYVPNYTSSNFKSASGDGVSENNASGAGSAYQTITTHLWSNTAAVNSLTFTVGGNFMQHSTASLYGITAGSSGGVVVS